MVPELTADNPAGVRVTMWGDTIKLLGACDVFVIILC
jgi:hypothetical protein